jgi:OFA family oxalate/formate antiporter-like MFS transporter
VGGIAFPILGGMLGDLGNFPLAFTICAIAIWIGALATAIVMIPDHEEATHPATMHGFLHQMHLDHLEDVVEHALHPDHYRRVKTP